MSSPSDQELAQIAHYDTIGDEYQLQYGDADSLLYRDRFCHQPMFDGLLLQGLKGLDAMCGSGHLSHYMEKHGVNVTGLDISPKQVEAYQQLNPNCKGVCHSMMRSPFDDNEFDLVAVVGGLHHLHPQLDTAISEIHRILKPGGAFCFVEPHTGSIMDWLRRAWYRHDSMFAESEEAIDVAALKRTFRDRFHFEVETYSGNIAYITVLNSMILRIPLAWKPHYSGLAMALEARLNPILPSWLACCVACRWRKA